MHQRDIATLVAIPSAQYTELAETIDRLREGVRRLELRMKLTAAIKNAAEVELAAEALRKAVSGTTECRESADDQQTAPSDSESSISASPTIAGSRIAYTEAAPLETKVASQEAAVRVGESAIAVSILNLYDRRGSFIKP